METEINNDEQNPSTSPEALPAKSRTKERARLQITPVDTDINDPENLDYEDVDDNHQIKQPNNPLKKSTDDIKSPLPNQSDENEVSNNNPATASDEGELDEADLEDGEIHDPSASKKKGSPDDDDDQNHSSTNTGVPSSPQTKVHCRFFLQGRCHWGPNCKYIHPNNDLAKTGVATDGVSSITNELSPPTSAPSSAPSTAAGNPWISPQAATATSQFFPAPLLRGQLPTAGLSLAAPTGTESAWERGLRSAKALREQSMRRKQQDKDFNDKKFTLTIRDTLDNKETDDNLLNVDRPSSIDYDLDHLSGSNYPDQHGFSDRYNPYMYQGAGGNSHFNNNHPHHRMNNNVRHKNHSMSSNDHPDRRARHADDYDESRNHNRNRKERSSVKDSRSIPKRDEESSYKRNSSQQQYPPGSHHNNDEQSYLNQYHNRRGDDWHDPWDRLRNHGGNTRRSSGGGRGPSYSSSSASSSSSSRSTRSRPHSSSSSSRSRSRSRSRPKRRSPSVTRASKPLPTSKTSSETVKNGNEKKSNGNKKLVSPSSTTNKFLPGRQISSHTLKKAEKSSNSSHSVANSHSKDQRGKEAEKKVKKSTRKENINRSNSTSSSSSSDSDGHRVTHRSSTSSSDSSSSENDTRPSTKTKTASGGSKTSTGNSSSHSKKAANRPLSSSSAGGSKNPQSKNDLTTRETSSKKRRDTSSSTGSATATKKSKLNTDSQKSSTDASNAENSDSNKKKETQKLLKKLQAVEKLINQRSTKASS